jgi:PIN domain nuclease of toxin-antitoxin system
MRLLLDTQLAVWWQIESRRVPEAARRLVLETDGPVYVSRASLWEMAI